jgi:hypothetical protein
MRQLATSLSALGAGGHPRAEETHVRSAVAWLGTAQRAGGGGGFAHSYHLLHGWERPYPETTGYILPTLWRADARFGIAGVSAMIEAAARWLAEGQGEDGSFCDLDGQKQVFDTGQILHGWNDLAASQPALVDAGRHIRAARWICGQQESDGSFVRHAWHGVAHSYYARVGAALVRAGRVLGEADIADAGMRHLRWVLAQQEPNGFFRALSFDAGPPFLHTMIYVVEGLLDGFADTGEAALLAAALRFMEPLAAAAERDGLPRSRYRPDFTPIDRELCLPGLAQWAAVCFRFLALGHSDFRAPGQRALAALKERQLVSFDRRLDGGMFGSAPLWGRYLRLCVPNWGVKFLIDALLAPGEAAAHD